MATKKEPLRNPKIQGVLEGNFKRGYGDSLKVMRTRIIDILTQKRK